MNNPLRTGAEDTAPSVVEQRQTAPADDTANRGLTDQRGARSLFRPLIFHTPARERSGARCHAEPDADSRHSWGEDNGVRGEKAGPLPLDSGRGTALSVALPSPEEVGAALDPEMAVMVRNGITRTPANLYHVDGYRYANLVDALAQVKRGATDRGRRS